MTEVRIAQLTTLPGTLDHMEQEARCAGFTMVTRLRDEWRSGQNRFAKEGEVFLGALRQDELIGIAGLNRDPYVDDPQIGRLRHVYVLERERRNCVGRKLVRQVLAHAQGRFAVVRLLTGRAASFYDSLGFDRAEGEHVTHILRLRGASSYRLRLNDGS